MSSYIQLPSKLNTSQYPVSCDFVSVLASGETVSSGSVTASVFAGVDADPSAIIDGAASISNNIITQRLIGGTPGVIYLLAFTAGTSTGNLLTIYAYQAVLNSTPFIAT